MVVVARRSANISRSILLDNTVGSEDLLSSKLQAEKSAIKQVAGLFSELWA
jgi:hypothetical protein